MMMTMMTIDRSSFGEGYKRLFRFCLSTGGKGAPTGGRACVCGVGREKPRAVEFLGVKRRKKQSWEVSM